MLPVVPERRLGAGREERACFYFTVSLRDQQSRKQPSLFENQKRKPSFQTAKLKSCFTMLMETQWVTNHNLLITMQKNKVYYCNADEYSVSSPQFTYAWLFGVQCPGGTLFRKAFCMVSANSV